VRKRDEAEPEMPQLNDLFDHDVRRALPRLLTVGAAHRTTLTKCPVKKRIVAMSYSRLCPHLQQVRVVLPANVLGKE
jgi:hypothetical protein